MLLTIQSLLFRFENPSKVITFNKRILSGINFTPIALVVQSVGVTKIGNNFANNL